MAQVPYTPYSTEQPQGGGIGGLSINTGEAFGANIGQALSGLGKTMDHAGNEIFGRALALQQLNNETEARDADTKYMIKAGELHAEFSSLQGVAAKDALPKYMKDLDESRVKIRNSLSNPMAQKVYDSNSLSTMGRSVFNGAGHAATQYKQYVGQSAGANLQLLQKTVEDNPDENTVRQSIERSKPLIDTINGTKGLPPDSPQAHLLQKESDSKFYSSWITGIARDQPALAATVLKENKTNLIEADYQRLENLVEGKSLAIAASNIAQDYITSHTKEDGTFDVDPQQMNNDLRDISDKSSIKNPLLAQRTVATAHSLLMSNRQAKRQFDYDNNLAVTDAIGQLVQNGGKTEQELRAMPGMDKLIEQLPPAKRNSIPAYINRLVSAKDKVTDEDNSTRINGMFNDPEQREAALNLDLTKEKLSQRDMLRFQDKQAKLRQNTDGDPRVNRAVGWMNSAFGAQMEALGIGDKTKNRDLAQYNHFRGALQASLDIFNETHKRPPTYQEFVKDIGPQLIQTRTDKGWIFNSTRAAFDLDIPDDLKSKVRQQAIKDKMPEPTEEDIYKTIVREQFKALYAKAPKAQDRPGGQ